MKLHNYVYFILDSNTENLKKSTHQIQFWSFDSLVLFLFKHSQSIISLPLQFKLVQSRIVVSILAFFWRTLKNNIFCDNLKWVWSEMKKPQTELLR